MNGLVVFYSRTGNTKRIAQELADELDWDIEEIHDTKKRAGIIGWLRSGFDAFREKLTEIKPHEKNPADYEIVLLGTPVWASKMTPAIRTYIKQNKENLNSTAFFCTEGAEGAEKLMESLAQYSDTEPIATLEVVQKEIKQNTYRTKLDKFIQEIEDISGN